MTTPRLKLSEAQLDEAELDELHDWANRLIRDDIRRACAEVRHYRALMATPIPCGWPAPEVSASISGHGPDEPYVYWESINAPIEPDEAIALGVALVNAGLAAKGETR